MRQKTQLPSCALPPTCSTREAAHLLGISVRTAQLWVEDGRLLAWKTPGGHRRILRSSIQHLIDEQQLVSHPSHSGKRLIVLNAQNEDGQLLAQEINAQFPECGVQALANPYQCLIVLGEQRPNILITHIDTVRANQFSLLETLTMTPALNGMLLVVVYPEGHQEKLPISIAVDVTMIPITPGNRELMRLIQAYLQGCRDGGRKG